MCGFFFVARKSGPVSKERFQAAFDSIRHRGPDRSWIRDGVVNAPHAEQMPPVHWMGGHHRLSILDLDERSDQPFRRGDNVLLFNGEIYNFRELRKNHEFADTEFTTEGDTELLFHGLKKSGFHALNKFNGMWAFLLLDESAGSLIAARDRFGKKPLFWYADSELICLSSTISAIDIFLNRQPRYDAEAARHFLVYGRLYPARNTETHHYDVKQVAPSGTLSFDFVKWAAKTGDYFKLQREKTGNFGDLPHLLEDSFRLRLVSDRPVGLLLSGGVDSSLLLSIAYARGLANDVRYFIGDTGRSEDADYAHRSIEALGLKATKIEISYAGQAFEHFLDVCRHQEKPFGLLGNAMAMGAMYQGVRDNGIPVAIDGTGGDEIFGGYWDRYYGYALRAAIAARDFTWIRRTFGANKNSIKHALRTISPSFLHGINRGTGRLSAIARFDPQAIRDRDPLSNDSLSFEDALVADAIGGRLGEWLWQNDRNAMMYSIENRSPILDFNLVPFFWTGYGAKFQGHWNKMELRQAFDSFRNLPTQWRVQKQGFRWNRRRFLDSNKDMLVEIADASETVNDLVDKKVFLGRIRKNNSELQSVYAQRLFVLSGLEAALGFKI